MSSPNRKIEHAGIIWKVVPGSRREQVLLRMIATDDQMRGKVIPIPIDDGAAGWLFPLSVGLLSGFCFGMLVGFWST